MSDSLTIVRRGRAASWPVLAFSLAVSMIGSPSLSQAQATPTPKPPPAQEISSSDVEPTFKLQTERNLVMVRLVVRNAKGATIENLRKEDIQLFDRGKLQTILHFSLEKPGLKSAPKPAENGPEKPAPEEPDAADETKTPASSAHRFLAVYFDDVHAEFESLVRARDAADHFLKSSVQAGDRLGLYTASGQKQVDFTEDLAQVHQALLDLRPRPIAGEDTSCGAVPPYEAYLIVERQDPTALGVATDELLNCNFGGDPQYTSQAQGQANAEAMRSLSREELEATASLRGIEGIVRRMSSLPGQRSVIIVSTGFLTETLRFNLSQIADRALRTNVILNALDARGLYTDSELTDVTKSRIAYTRRAAVTGQKSLMLIESARRQSEGMQALALDTGGIFFNNSNDLDAGFRKLAGLPEAFYLLAFSPQNIKLDGSFHPLQVKLASLKGLSVQARRGYYAPRKPDDPTVQEKEEIREAVYSQDEMHELPIEVHTQFFMKSESDARITVLTRLDLRPLQFRKEEDRNLDNLTFVTVVFDRDGHVVDGQEKSVQFRMRDVTLDRYRQSGITMRTLFDVKPGTYLVRSVVRDSQGGQISSLNRTVEIPY